MNLKWKDIYNENKNRRYSEVSGIKKENVSIESNPFGIIKKRSYIFIVIALALIAIVLYTFRNDLKVALMVLVFFTCAAAFMLAFSYFKLECTKDGLYIKFGLQQGLFKYDRIKNIYISRYNDSSYIAPFKSYNIVIRYEDNFARLKELFFSASFLNKEEVAQFLDNFEVKEVESTKYANFERFKLLKKVGKIAMIVLFILVIGFIGFGYMKR